MTRSSKSYIDAGSPEGVGDEGVKMVMLLIQKDGYSKTALDNTACSLNLSGSRLTHKFAEELHMSPLQYAKRLKLDRAKQLIETTRSSIKDIAYTMGYKSPSRFAIDFKKAYGLSPTECRASSRH